MKSKIKLIKTITRKIINNIFSSSVVVITALQVVFMLVSSCERNKPKRPLSTETIDSGAVEVYCDEAYIPALDTVFDFYKNRYKKVTLDIKPASARNVLAHLLAGKTRVAIVGRDNLPDEDSLMQLYNVAPYYRMDISNDALVFFANPSLKTDTLNEKIIFEVLTENKKIINFLPGLQIEPELVIAEQNSSEYGNLTNIVTKKKPIKKNMLLLPNSDSVISYVKSNPNAIGICYLSQVQGKFFKLLRIGYTSKDGSYIRATKPVHQSYVIMGEYPYTTMLRLYLLEDRKNLPFWFGAFIEKEAICVQYYKRARLMPVYAKYKLEDERR